MNNIHYIIRYFMQYLKRTLDINKLLFSNNYIGFHFNKTDIITWRINKFYD